MHMPNYYELLQLNPTATPGEIQAALDQQLARCVALATHHQPAVANQATATMHLLEQARSTLLDQAQRAQYDAQIGLGLAGGLGEPVPSTAAPAVPTPPGVPSRQAPPPAGGWVCPQCHASNREGSRYCSKCRHQLADNCPMCKMLVLHDEAFCPECGVAVSQTRELVNRWRQLQADLKQTAGRLQSVSRLLPEHERALQAARRIRWRWGLAGLAILAFGWLSGGYALMVQYPGEVLKALFTYPTWYAWLQVLGLLLGPPLFFFLASPFARLRRIRAAEAILAATRAEMAALQAAMQRLDAGNREAERELGALKPNWRAQISAA